jgi:hypothetical protein
MLPQIAASVRRTLVNAEKASRSENHTILSTGWPRFHIMAAMKVHIMAALKGCATPIWQP